MQPAAGKERGRKESDPSKHPASLLVRRPVQVYEQRLSESERETKDESGTSVGGGIGSGVEIQCRWLVNR